MTSAYGGSLRSSVSVGSMIAFVGSAAVLLPESSVGIWYSLLRDLGISTTASARLSFVSSEIAS